MTERPIIFSGPMVRAILAGRKTVTRRVVKPQPDDDELGMWTHESLGGYFAEHVFGACFAKLGDSCPYGVPGDRLWLREAWRISNWTEGPDFEIQYKADQTKDWREMPDLFDEGDRHTSYCIQCTDDCNKAGLKTGDNGCFITPESGTYPTRWRPSIHMPRWASRITLEVVDVRVERLQAISEADAKAEGMLHHDGGEIWHSGWRHDRSHGYVYGTAREAFAVAWDSINGKFHPWSSNPWVWRVEFKRVEAK